MNNVKTYRDGDRFILVVENCNGSLAAKVNEFIVSIMGIEEEPIEVPLIPIEVKDEDVPDISSCEEILRFNNLEKQIDSNLFRFVDGLYKGMTIDEALEKDGVKAVAYTFAHIKEVAPNCTEQIRKKCEEILFSDYGVDNYNPEFDSENDFRKFIDTYDSILNETFKTISDQAGYENIQVMIDSARENLWRAGYSAALQKLRDIVNG